MHHRWANIIITDSGSWCVIDCEFARKVGSLIPQELQVKCDWTSTCSPSTDLYCIGMMLSSLDDGLLDKPLHDLRKLLTSKAKNFDKSLTADNVLGNDCFAWLRQASPTKPGECICACALHMRKMCCCSKLTRIHS